jgi:hypothetical protein
VTKTRDEAHAQLQHQRQQFELEIFQLREALAKEEEKRQKEKEVCEVLIMLFSLPNSCNLILTSLLCSLIDFENIFL